MEIRAPGSRAVSCRTRKHILLVPRHAAPDQHYFLRQRCPAPSGARQRLPAGIRRHRNRNRQPGSRIFIGRQDRVWPYPVRRGRHNDLWCSTRTQRHHRVRWCGGAAWTDWILRGFLCRSDQCIDPAPARSGPQRRCDRAAANLISFIGIFLASGTYYVFTAFAGLGPKTIFLLSAGMTLGATIYVTRLLPDSLMRLLLWLATNTIYRIRVNGRENIPSKGGALLVSNHLSFVDALLLIASTDRFIRFLIFKDIYERPFIKPFARIIQAIPISSKQRPREMIAALREASETIKAGGIVCIFAEGQITRVGHLLPFRRGFERIMKGVDAPIIPVNLDGVWGSIFSFERQQFFLKVPHQTHRISVSFGRPMPAIATAFEVRQAVQELESKAFAYRKERMKPLGQTIVKTARRHWFRFAMA